jgi:tetratricopeptide (TPR) repeat protein
VSSCDSKKKIAEIQGENRKSLAKSESDNGLSDSMTLSMVEVIASNFAELRDYEKADALYKRLFVAVQEAYLPCSKESADVLEQMARVAVHQGRLVEATKILHRVRDIQSSLKKPSSPETLETSERIAGLYERQGLYDDAIGEYKEIIKYRMDTPGSRAEETLRVMECRANAYRVKGKRDKNALETAAARYREVVQIRIQNLRQCKQRTEEQQEGPTEQQCQSYLRETMKKLAEVYRALGNSREERILREELVLLEAREKSKPPPDTSKPIK